MARAEDSNQTPEDLQVLYDRMPGLREVHERARAGFFEKFHCEAEEDAYGCGRVELIGNFTDQLKGGHAIGAPITNVTVASVGKREDRLVYVCSDAFLDDGVVILNLDNLESGETPQWANYIKGALVHLVDVDTRLDTSKIQGANIHISTNLPKVGGVSSSAALEMAVGLSLLKLYGLGPNQVEDWEIAQAMRNAEIDERYVVGSCGYLDQASSISEGPVLLEFAEQENGAPYGARPVDLSLLRRNGYRICIGVGGARNLQETGYAHKARVATEAHGVLVNILNGAFPDLESLITHKQKVVSQTSEEAYKALLHLLSEDERVLKMVEVLNWGNITAVLELINDSGNSSIENWGVADAVGDKVAAVPQLPYLVDLAKRSGASAARNHGGGWNTTFLFIASDGEMEDVKAEIRQGYEGEYGQTVQFVDVEIGTGSQVLPTKLPTAA